MHINWSSEVYSPREVAKAAGVADQQAIAVLGRADLFLGFADAVRLARRLRPVGVLEFEQPPQTPSGLFSIYDAPATPQPLAGTVPLVLSSTLHLGAIALAIAVTTFGLAPTAALRRAGVQANRERMVFLVAPGPGGGGGGGGASERTAPPKAERAGRARLDSPLPVRQPPAASEQMPPPLAAEPLPAVVAPIVSTPADARDRAGVLEQARTDAASRGTGQGGGVGEGSGTGVGRGDGSGVGHGTGGGTGGGPFRPGAGIEPPRLLHETKANYTEDARRRGVEGNVVLELVVRHDGTVGEIRTIKRLGAGLDESAAAAVRQWRFAPAQRQGQPVDVVVEVAVEFKLR